MNNINTINGITLEYLLNPVLYDKVKNNKEPKSKNNLENIEFYKDRIITITKKMCKNKFENDTLKSAFIVYVNTLIYHFKTEDVKNIIQEEYKNINNNDRKLDSINENIDYNDNSLNKLIDSTNLTNELNKLLIKNDVKDLNCFVTKKKLNNNKKNTFIPKQKNLHNHNNNNNNNDKQNNKKSKVNIDGLQN